MEGKQEAKTAAQPEKAPSEEMRSRYRKTRQRWIDGSTAQSGPGKTPSRERLPHGTHYNGLMEEELFGLRAGGFRDVDCFWKFTNYGTYGGFKPG